jgi:hypothetical protein
MYSDVKKDRPRAKQYTGPLPTSRAQTSADGGPALQHNDPRVSKQRSRNGSIPPPRSQGTFSPQRPRGASDRTSPTKAFAKGPQTITTRLATTLEEKRVQEARDKAYLTAPEEDVQIAAEVCGKNKTPKREMHISKVSARYVTMRFSIGAVKIYLRNSSKEHKMDQLTLYRLATFGRSKIPPRRASLAQPSKISTTLDWNIGYGLCGM